MIYSSKAPLRISFCGGGTDLPDYFEEHGGVVLSTTSNKYAYGTLLPSVPVADGPTEIYFLNYDNTVKYDVGENVRRGNRGSCSLGECQHLSDGKTAHRSTGALWEVLARI